MREFEDIIKAALRYANGLLDAFSLVPAALVEVGASLRDRRKLIRLAFEGNGLVHRAVVALRKVDVRLADRLLRQAEARRVEISWALSEYQLLAVPPSLDAMVDLAADMNANAVFLRYGVVTDDSGDCHGFASHDEFGNVYCVGEC